MTMMALNGPAKAVLGQIELDDKENFSHAQIEKFKSQPELYRHFVKSIEKDINGAFPIVSTFDRLLVISTIGRILTR